VKEHTECRCGQKSNFEFYISIFNIIVCDGDRSHTSIYDTVHFQLGNSKYVVMMLSGYYLFVAPTYNFLSICVGIFVYMFCGNTLNVHTLVWCHPFLLEKSRIKNSYVLYNCTDIAVVHATEFQREAAAV